MESLLLKYGYALLFLGVAFEKGEAVLLAAALLAQRGYFRLPVVIAVAVAANALADQVYFQLARLRGRTWLDRRFGQHPRYQQLIGLVGRRGGLLLLASRFAYGFRIAIPAACGALGMGVVAFTLLDLLAGVLLGTADGGPRLLRRGGARTAARGRAALRRGDRSPARGRPSRRSLGPPARAAGGPVARAGVGRPAHGGAIRRRPDGRPQPALGHLAPRAGRDERARAVASARGHAAQPRAHAPRGPGASPGHAQPRPAQGARVVGGRGRALGLAPLHVGRAFDLHHSLVAALRHLSSAAASRPGPTRPRCGRRSSWPPCWRGRSGSSGWWASPTFGTHSSGTTATPRRWRPCDRAC